MLEKRDREQGELTLVGPLRSFIPDDHILVRIDGVLDLSWLRDEVEDLYCLERGRPGIDPESALRLMLAGLIEGIIHDRALLRRAQTDIAIRWFAGYRLDEELPDHSTLSRIRQRWGPEVFERVFEQSVAQCIEAKLVDASAVHVDATLVRADASPNSFVKEHVAQVLAANEGGDSSDAPTVDEDSAKSEPGEKEPPGGDGGSSGAEGSDEAKRSLGDVELAVDRGGGSRKSKNGPRRSLTDPDCRFARSSRRTGYAPSYKAHVVVEDSHGVVVGSALTAGNVHEGETLMGLIEAVESRTDQDVQGVAADTAYGMASNYGALERSQREAVIPAQAPPRHRGGFPASRFSYDPVTDRVRCPRKCYLHRYRKHDRGVDYRSLRSDCQDCRHASSCLPSSRPHRTITVPPDHAPLLRARRRQCRGEIRSHCLSRKRWGRVERLFGESKCCHGLGRAARRGLAGVWTQLQLTFAIQNLRRLVGPNPASGLGRWISASLRGLTRALLRPSRGGFSAWGPGWAIAA